MEVLLAKMTSSKDAATRYECMKALNTGLKEFERVAALSLNMVAGSWHAENTERGFEQLRSQRNLGNNVPDEVVDSLLDAVKTTGVDYCKRYYSLKKGILKNTQGLETMTWADRNASINIGTSSESYTWNEAVDIVKAGEFYKYLFPYVRAVGMTYVFKQGMRNFHPRWRASSRRWWTRSASTSPRRTANAAARTARPPTATVLSSCSTSREPSGTSPPWRTSPGTVSLF